ncbi:MAG: hypothetical protein WD995_06525, partial [Gemmatimonadota bacterium]
MFVGGNPFNTPSIYLMIPFLEREAGVWSTRGGMYSVMEALGRLFIEPGGPIETGREVWEVLVRDGRAVGVRTDRGTIEADIVVSSEDVSGLYLVGAGTHPGAGVPGVLLSAEATYGCVAAD